MTGGLPLPYFWVHKNIKPMNLKINTLCFLLFASLSLSAQQQPGTKGFETKMHFVSTSAFMLFNLLPFDNPPGFAQLNYGYRFDAKNTLIAEAITWQYEKPLGTPYGPDQTDTSNHFPGVIREHGIGLAYQRFLYKGFYSTVHATPLRQRYLDKDKKLIKRGFQLFCTARLGYHFEALQGRLFIEPSIAVTFWPVVTGMPASFKTEQDKWPKYFLWEPGLHVGYQF